MSQHQGEYPRDDQPGRYQHDAEPRYGQPSDDPGSQYAQDQDAYQHYGNQNYSQYGYDQGGGYPQGYDQGGYDGYQHGQQPAEHAAHEYAAHPDYSQGYGQYGGAHSSYGYDRGGDQRLSASLILDDGSNRHYQLTEGSTVVGRGQEAQFRLPDTGVSRRHLEITWDGRTAVLADLGSTNGTSVNGSPVQTWQLADGDVVRVGQSQLVFRTQG